ncbi:MAG: hypothetical protein DRO88_03145 [Promethearchaeia archaeon]|nr:MAG: hypothetical protein DRO88_03145 [Candidatus Lokiarchaeia archaeon]
MLFQYGIDFDFSLPSIIISLIINIAVAFIIANDAKSRGIDPTGYVLLTCCCGFCIGGIVYLIVRSNNPPGNTFGGQEPGFSSYDGYGQSDPSNLYGRPDGESGYTTPPSSDSSTSTYRPQPTEIKTKVCSLCGSENPIDARFCSNCGSNTFNI